MYHGPQRIGDEQIDMDDNEANVVVVPKHPREGGNDAVAAQASDRTTEAVVKILSVIGDQSI